MTSVTHLLLTVSVVLAALSHCLVSGLVPYRRLSFLHRQQRRDVSKSFLRNSLPDLGDLISGGGGGFSLPSEKQTQLWLDLRGTVVHPRMAVDYLMEQLNDEEFFSLGQDDVSLEPYQLIDKVLVSDSTFQSLVNASDPFVTESDFLLYVPENKNNNAQDNNLVALSKKTLSIPFGSLMAMPIDSAVAVADPMEAMSMLTDGKWIILFNEEEGKMEDGKEIPRIEAVGNFLDIASTATTLGWAAPDFGEGLLLQAIAKEGEESLENNDASGGVAVVCTTKSSVVQFANVLQCFRSNGTTSLSESGILIQGDASGPSLPTAIVIPFEVVLWKAALMVSGPLQFLK